MPGGPSAPFHNQFHVFEGVFEISEDVSTLYPGQIWAYCPFRLSKVGLDFSYRQGWFLTARHLPLLLGPMGYIGLVEGRKSVGVVAADKAERKRRGES